LYERLELTRARAAKMVNGNYFFAANVLFQYRPIRLFNSAQILQQTIVIVYTVPPERVLIRDVHKQICVRKILLNAIRYVSA
jgi:hypothetical protein